VGVDPVAHLAPDRVAAPSHGVPPFPRVAGIAASPPVCHAGARWTPREGRPQPWAGSGKRRSRNETARPMQTAARVPATTVTPPIVRATKNPSRSFMT